jgi:hypothetical protein
MYFEADLHMDADETGKVIFLYPLPKKKTKKQKTKRNKKTD